MANELKTHAVKVGDIERIDRDLRADFFAQLLFGDRQHAHQFIVKINLQLRLHRQQRWRGRVVEIQQRFRYHFIAAHAELYRTLRARAAQHHAARRRGDFSEGQLHVAGRGVIQHHHRCRRVGERRRGLAVRHRTGDTGYRRRLRGLRRRFRIRSEGRPAANAHRYCTNQREFSVHRIIIIVEPSPVLPRVSPLRVPDGAE